MGISKSTLNGKMHYYGILISDQDLELEAKDIRGIVKKGERYFFEGEKEISKKTNRECKVYSLEQLMFLKKLNQPEEENWPSLEEVSRKNNLCMDEINELVKIGFVKISAGLVGPTRLKIKKVESLDEKIREISKEYPESREEKYPLIKKEYFENTFLIHYGEILRYVKRLSNWSLAEDRTQEVFATALRYYKTNYEDKTNPIAWLKTIAKNQIINEHKKVGRNPIVTNTFDEGNNAEKFFGTTPKKEIKDFEGNNRSASDLLDYVKENFSAKTYDALMEITSGSRESILLNVLGDLKYNEIAEITDTPVGTVMSRLYRARKNLN